MNQDNNRWKTLLRTIAIYGLGNIGSRAITFALVPVYSFFIAPADFGYYDLCFSAMLFFLPILSMQFRDGAFRFLMDADTDEQRSAIVSFALRKVVCNVLFFMSLALVVDIFADIKYMWHTVVFAAVFSTYEVAVQMLRGLGHGKLFAATGIINSFGIFFLSVPLVAFTDMGVEGVFLGNIAARIVTLLIVEMRVGMFSKYFKWKVSDVNLGKEMVRFSVPLILVNYMIWVIAHGNRFAIEYFFGLETNGLFAIAIKFMSILEVLAYVFIQAWQESAIRQYQAPDRDQFFSKTLNAMIWVMNAIVIAIGVTLHFGYKYVVGDGYIEGEQYVYPMLFAAMLLQLNYFYDVVYYCEKQSKRELYGYIFAASVAIVANITLIRFMGPYGVAAALGFTYLSLAVYRIIDCKKYITLKLNLRSAGVIALTVAGGVSMHCLEDGAMLYSALLAVVVLYLALMPREVIEMAKKKLKRR